jgi:hypothetical protein
MNANRQRWSRVAVLLAAFCFAPAPARAETIWVEGEKPTKANVSRHPWWYDQVERHLLSGGDFISHWHDTKAGEVEYRISVAKAAKYDFWVRANPLQTKLSYRVGDGKWREVDFEKKIDVVNVAAKGAADIRFLAWVHVGKLDLAKGEHTVAFRMDSKNHNHGMLDCFVFTDEPFEPRGTRKPGEKSSAVESDKGWFAFDAVTDPFQPGEIDLRFLNEKEAGEHGFIGVKGSHFIRGDGQPLRFWAVNGPSSKDRDGLRREARLLARYGVNLARIHHGYYDDKGTFSQDKVKHTLDAIEALKAEGIYSHLSIYFPLWLRPAPGTEWLEGYDGKAHPFAALFFNPEFQKKYRTWWKTLLHTPNERTGKRLVDDPALMSLEVQNEDSLFFWTFDPTKLPDAEARMLESRFGEWLKTKYGSLDAAFAAWKGTKVPRDNAAEGRVSFRPLWSMFNDKTPRDRDAARFLVEVQRRFYTETIAYLRDELGFKGLITASNWVTASPQVLGPLEKYSYTVGDFIDRHGYFGCRSKGQFSEWSIRDGHTYVDRSAYRFDAEEPGKPRSFAHPAMDPHYDGKPSMLSEIAWNRPNRYRSEAPIYLAAYGALQDSDAIVHFAMDGARWTVRPGFFMQPWTIMSPATMGQFPATALLYRKGLVSNGDVLVDLNLKIDDLLDLRGTPLPQDAAFDELRLKDVPQGTELKAGNVIDPLVHYAGRTNVRFTAKGASPVLAELSAWIDRKGQVVRSTTKELNLDYGKGVLTIDATAVQGVSGALASAGSVKTKDLTLSSPLEIGHILAVSVDGEPLATSRKILVQVMSEEKATEFRTEPADKGQKRIVSIGHDPWLVRELAGSVRFHRPDAAQLKVTALDFNGANGRVMGRADEIRLEPRTVYYLVSP